MKFSQDAARIPNRARKIEQSLQPRLQTHFVQGAYLHQAQGKSCRWNQPVLDATRCADKQYLGAVPLLEFMGDGQRGDYVSARPAPRQNGPHDLTINRKLPGRVKVS
jgi:hypothetical protein